MPNSSPHLALAPAHVSSAGASDVHTALLARRINAQTQGSSATALTENARPADCMLAARAPRSCSSTLCPSVSVAQLFRTCTLHPVVVRRVAQRLSPEGSIKITQLSVQLTGVDKTLQSTTA